MTESDIFDPKLLQRLTRPLVQPGVISPRMARGIILRAQRFASRLPLLAIAQRHYNVAELKTEQLPIVYAQSRQDETQTASGISLGTNADAQKSQPDASQTTVVQAKFASAKSPASLPVNPDTQPVILQQQNPTNTRPLSSSLPLHSVPDQGNLASQSLPIVYAQSRQDETQTASGISLGANADAQKSQTEASQPMVVQAKFASAKSPASLTVNPDTQPVVPQEQNPTNTLPLSSSIPLRSVPIQSNLASQSLPIVYAQSRQDAAVKTLINIVSTEEAIATPNQPSPPRKLVVRETRINSVKSNTPLVFSSPPAIAPQASQELPNTTIEEFSTISMNPERSPVTFQSPPNPNLRSQVNHSNNLAPQIDIDTLAAKIERKLMRKLIVENERRGRKL
jgi:hypothetical protein